MNISLEGKIALVTGASGGIGAACAMALSEAGAELILVGRTLNALAQVRNKIESRGKKARILQADVTDFANLEQVFSSLERVDILVNNAGTNIPDPFEAVKLEHFDTVFDLNIKAAFFVSQHVLHFMDSGGVIVNISSHMGHVGAVNRTIYCASKHALEGFTKALGVELAPRGIRVVSVAPTFIETDMTRPMLEHPEFRKSVLQNIPMNELGQVEDVANAVVFLASSSARMVTGSSLIVDGGWTAK
jgi:NAD(P)-dependent dehydrogenase (short-subunit alcohol dehydrogenase family)